MLVAKRRSPMRALKLPTQGSEPFASIFKLMGARAISQHALVLSFRSRAMSSFLLLSKSTGYFFLLLVAKLTGREYVQLGRARWRTGNILPRQLTQQSGLFIVGIDFYRLKKYMYMSPKLNFNYCAIITRNSYYSPFLNKIAGFFPHWRKRVGI